MVLLPLACWVGDTLFETIQVARSSLKRQYRGAIGISTALQVEPSPVGAFDDLAIIWTKSVTVRIHSRQGANTYCQGI